MPKQNVPLTVFNRGIVSPLALARVDVDRLRLSAEEMVNWIPKTLGAMRIRPGLGYLGATKSNLVCMPIEFVAATDDTALLELTNLKMRVWVDDALVSRVSVTTAISNGSFATSASWTDASENGGTLTFGGTGLILDPVNVGGLAKCTRQITVASGDQNKEHGLAIVVTRGPVLLKVGSTAGDDDYVSTTRLLTGRHHLAFTPTGDFHLEFSVTNRTSIQRIIASIAVEAAGTLEVTAPWATADLPKLQWDQSADVIFVACDGYKPHRIERRSVTSWSIVEYKSDDGPFAGQTADVQLKPAASHGNTTLTSDRAFFSASHVGALFRLYHTGQRFTVTVAGDNQFTDPIRVSGVVTTNVNDRDWTYTITGTWSGTLKVQRSFEGDDFGFQPYPADQSAGATIDITANAATTNEDGDNNAIIWYRVGFEDNAYTSGAASIQFEYDGGGDYGICRVTAYTSATQVSVEVLRPFRGTTFTHDWSEGSFSAAQVYPSSVALHEGRLWWFGGAQAFASVSDDYESFDQEFIGDAGPIIRTIGAGPVDSVNFALSMQRLVIGTAGAEHTVKSSSFDEPLTPQNNVIKPTSSQGSKALTRAARLDGRGIFIQRSGKRVFELVFDPQSLDYVPNDLTLLAPEICEAGVVSIGIQRQPDTRVHFALADGTVAVLTYEPAEDVLCWSRVETDGNVENVAVLPGDDEDQVYYVIARTVDGSTVRYLEKWAVESDTLGDGICKLADSFVVYDGSATTSIPVAHLEGEDVVVWADGNVIEEQDGDGVWSPTLHTVTSGVITLDTAASEVMAGLYYEAQYKSTKLAYAAGGGSALTMTKRVESLGLILSTTHHHGLRYGPNFTTLDTLPEMHEEAQVATGTVFDAYDAPPVTFNGDYSTDSRICLQGQSPYPVTVLAAVIGMQTNG